MLVLSRTESLCLPLNEEKEFTGKCFDHERIKWLSLLYGVKLRGTVHVRIWTDNVILMKERKTVIQISY
jgi:hypothetical protein